MTDTSCFCDAETIIVGASGQQAMASVPRQRPTLWRDAGQRARPARRGKGVGARACAWRDATSWGQGSEARGQLGNARRPRA